jgi:peptidoglycan/xylan/chitin deacetylase (PgdA/CDA1 family)
MGNHTMNHLYDLTELSPYEIENEINQGGQLIKETIGKRPKGFRAPGYNIHLGIIDILKHNGYLYDSSVFPCPVYYSAKAAAMGLKTMKGMHSSSILGDPRILRAPTGPYKIGDEGVWARGDRFNELPITVVTPARLPFIGTSLSMMGNIPATLLARAAAKLSFVNLELHGIDFADADGDGIGHLKEVQPDLRIPLTKRRNTLTKVIKTLVDAGMEAVTLQDASRRLLI